jgi:hypothetical protein
MHSGMDIFAFRTSEPHIIFVVLYAQIQDHLHHSLNI